MCVLFSLSLSPDIKPEQVALGRLREAEDVCWRLVMDLERVLCYSAAKINQTVYMGHMMVCGTVSGPLLDSFVVCGRLVTTTTCTLLIPPPPPPPPGYCATPYWNSQPRKTGLSIMGFYHADTVPIMHDVNNVLVVC